MSGDGSDLCEKQMVACSFRSCVCMIRKYHLYDGGMELNEKCPGGTHHLLQRMKLVNSLVPKNILSRFRPVLRRRLPHPPLRGGVKYNREKNHKQHTSDE